MRCLPTMSARFALYLHYFLSHWPTDDHGARPFRPLRAVTPSTSGESPASTFTVSANVPHEKC